MFLRKVSLTFAALSFLFISSNSFAVGGNKDPNSQNNPPANSDPILPVLHTEISYQNSPVSDLDSVQGVAENVGKVEVTLAGASTPAELEALLALANKAIAEEKAAGGQAHINLVGPVAEEMNLQKHLRDMAATKEITVQHFDLPNSYTQKFKSFNQSMREYGNTLVSFNPLAEKDNVWLSIAKTTANFGVPLLTATIFAQNGSHIPWEFAYQFPATLAAISGGIGILNPIMPWNMLTGVVRKIPAWFTTEVVFLEVARHSMIKINLMASELGHSPYYSPQGHLEIWKTAALSTISQGVCDVTTSAICDKETEELDLQMNGVDALSAQYKAAKRKIAWKLNYRQFLSSIFSVGLAAAEIRGVSHVEFGFYGFMAFGAWYANKHFDVTGKALDYFKNKNFSTELMLDNCENVLEGIFKKFE